MTVSLARQSTFVMLALLSASSGCTSRAPTHSDCYVLPGSSIDIAREDGLNIDRSPATCVYLRRGNGVLYVYSTPSGATWIYAQLAGTRFEDGASGFTVARSTLVDTLSTGGAIDLGAALEALNEQGSTPNSLMVASYVALDDGTRGWYESSGGGSARVETGVTAEGTTASSWPSGVGTYAATAITFETAPMRPRLSADYGGGTGVVWPDATATARLRSHIGHTRQLQSCPSPGPGGAGCVSFDTACDLTDPSACTSGCTGSVCLSTGSGSAGRCCVMNGFPCGRAGTGTECCSGVCSNDAVCGEPPASMSCDGSDAGLSPSTDSGTGGGTVWGCVDSGDSCECRSSHPAGTTGLLTGCTTGYNCCVGYDIPGYDITCQCFDTSASSCSDYQSQPGHSATCSPP